MIDPASQAQLKEAIADRIGTDQGVLDALRKEIRPLKSAMRPIHLSLLKVFEELFWGL